MDQIVHFVEYVGQATFVMHINDSWMWFTHGNQTWHKYRKFSICRLFFSCRRDMENTGAKDKSKKT